MSSFARVKIPASLPRQVSITNSNFSTSTAGVNGSQVGLTDANFTSEVTGWTKTGGINAGTNTANDVRLLGYLRNNNASPRFWNATPSSSSGNIITAFFVAQNSYTSLPKTFSISQTITIPEQGTYTARFWAAPRTGDTTLSNNVYYPSQSVAMYVGSDLIGTKTFAISNTLSPPGFYPGFELVSGNFTTSAANQSRTIRFDWVQNGTNDSTIMITGIEIYR